MSEQEQAPQNEAQANKKPKASDYFKLGPVLGYWFRKKDPNRPTNTNIRLMHGINKISMIMFLICLIIILIRRFG